MAIINGYSDDQVKNWMQGKTQDEVAQQAAGMGLTSDQVAQAYGTIGQNYNANDVNWWAGQHGYNFGGANGAGQNNAVSHNTGIGNYGMDPNAKNPLGLGPIGRDALVPTSGGNGKKLTVGEVRDFAATNPSTEDILKQAANYHMSLEELTGAMSYANGGYGDMSKLLDVNDMINKSKGVGYDASGWIVPTNGLGKQQKYDKTGEWIVGGNGDAFPGSHKYDQTNDFTGMPQSGRAKYTPGMPQHGGSGGGGANLGFGGGDQNPYLQGMGNTIINQMTDNYNRNQAPAMRSGAMAAGGFGGSRDGVVQANGLKDLNMGIGQNLTNLYGTDWTNQQNRNLQQQQINNSYDLGLKSNNLGFANLDSNNAQFGANHGLNVLEAQNRWANNGVAAANGIQNTPNGYAQYFNNNANQIAGQGGTQTNTQNNPGNPYAGAIGGAQLFNSWWNKK